MTQPFPEAAEYPADPEAETAITWLKGVIEGLRNIRGEANIKPGQEIRVLLQHGSALDHSLADDCATLLQRLAKVSEISWLADEAEPPPNALALVGDLRIMVPLAGLIDVAAEQARLQKELERKQSDRDRTEKKLSNPSFVDKAPDAVVEKERVKLREIDAALVTLNAQLTSLRDL